MLQRAGAAPRQALVDLLWPEEPPPAWDAALSALLSRLKSVLGAPALRATGLGLETTPGQCRLLLPADTFVDVEYATTSLDLAEGLLRRGDMAAAFGPATAALAILRRPFLPGDVSAWAEAMQRKLARAHLRAIEVVGEVYLANREPKVTLELAMEAIGLDAFHEASRRLAMRAHDAAGDRAGAVRAYRDLCDLLKLELETEPSEETQLLHRELSRKETSPLRR